MSLAKLKNGICMGSINSNGIVKSDRTLGLYYEGIIDQERIKKEIIPDIEDHLKRGWNGISVRTLNFSIIIYSYYSVYGPSKNGIGITLGKNGLRFSPMRPKTEKNYDWFIDENKNIFKIDKNKIII